MQRKGNLDAGAGAGCQVPVAGLQEIREGFEIMVNAE